MIALKYQNLAKFVFKFSEHSPAYVSCFTQYFLVAWEAMSNSKLNQSFKKRNFLN